MATVERGCLENVGAEPEVPDELGTDDHSTDPACDPKWELCADAQAVQLLGEFVSAAKDWIRDVKTQCKKKEENQ